MFAKGVAYWRTNAKTRRGPYDSSALPANLSAPLELRVLKTALDGIRVEDFIEPVPCLLLCGSIVRALALSIEG